MHMLPYLLSRIFVLSIFIPYGWLLELNLNCSLVCAVGGRKGEDGHFNFVERNTKILYCGGEGEWNTLANAGETSDPYLKSNYSCKISPEIFIGIQSQTNKSLLDGNCSLDPKINVTRTFDFLLLSYNKKTVLVSKITAQTFIKFSDANCFVRLAAKWFIDEVFVDLFYCGSTDPGLRNLASWSVRNVFKNCIGLPDGVYYIQPTTQSAAFKVYCKAGWALILKIDGTKSTFEYASTLWTSTVGLATDSTNEDQIEAKLPSYWTLPVSKLLLVMNSSQGTAKELTVPLSASLSGLTLHALISDGMHRQTIVGRAAWKSLVPDSSLQLTCNREGFNSGEETIFCRVRLGIISNNENDCNSANSFVGIGASNNDCGLGGLVTSGNEASLGGDNGDKQLPTFSFVFGQ